MAEYLFIGGYADGEWHFVAPQRATAVVAEYGKTPAYKEGAIHEAPHKAHTYERVSLCFPSGETIFFFDQATLNPTKALAKLLRAYIPTQEP